MQGLPVGVQSFRMLRQKKLVYVDKTKHIYDLVSGKRGGYYFFLSRPRRFGKSLLISTLKELFLGNKDLFESLWIAQSDYQWEQHNVIHLDFSSISSTSVQEFKDSFSSELSHMAHQFNIDISAERSPSDRLKMLINRLSNVVLLIDEYDRPLLQHVNNSAVMEEMQSVLRDLYTVIKGSGGNISFLFMTGVTKFSKTSIFSGLNNLIDLTLSTDAADLLGYTDAEIDHYFQPHMQDIADKQNMLTTYVKQEMQHWYNGYQFSKEPIKVYNPFSVLMYLFTQDLRNYWFETGTPLFLVDLIRAKQYSVEDLDHAEIHTDNLAAFDIGTMRLIPLLLQTGYLTFKSYNPETRNYQLGYPNEETKSSFLLYFIEMITDKETAQISNAIAKLTRSLKENDLEQFFTTLKIFFASVPYTMQLPQEKYYQSIFYVIMSLVGAYVQAEVATNDGRIDCTVQTAGHLYIFEFKLYDSAATALEQIHNKKYYQSFLHTNKMITLIGVAFDVKQRNISDWIAQEVSK